MSALNETEKLKKRFSELAERADKQWRIVCSDFLTLDEQSILCSSYYPVPVQLLGGYETAERKVACFGSFELEEIKSELPVSCLEISPVSQKFADKLSHRDFLGALMNLGIKRETLGDIIVYENSGYVYCLEKISDYIVENLSCVKHTTVKCKRVSAPPVDSIALPEETCITVSSDRTDVLIASVFKLSRSAVNPLFVQGKVFISGKQITSSSHQLKAGDIISVRGYGRFIFCDVEGKTKKDRLRVIIRKFK